MNRTDAHWLCDAFEALRDGMAHLSPALKRWAFPLDLRIGVERLLGVAHHPLRLLTLEECERRQGARRRAAPRDLSALAAPFEPGRGDRYHIV